MIENDALPILFQFADGLFPAGGFAHSFGLETYVQDGRVRDRAGLEAFIAAFLEGSAGPCDAVAVAVATRFASGDDADGCRDLDQKIDAMKVVPELRAASRQMGRQTLRIAGGLRRDDFLETLRDETDAGRMAGHHAVVVGACLGRFGIGAGPAAAAFLYSTAALLVGAGLRLMALGQLDGQRALASMQPRIVTLAAEAAAKCPDDIWSFTPGLDIAGVRHEALPARLFRS
jgi:urease accessory protein